MEPPAPPAATVTLAELYLRQGHTEEAQRIFGEIVEREPGALDSQFAVHRYLRLAEKTAVGFHWDW